LTVVLPEASEAELASGDASELTEDMVALLPDGVDVSEMTQVETPPSEATEEVGLVSEVNVNPADDVFVLLPDGHENIPMVDTEELTAEEIGDVGGGGLTEELSAGVGGLRDDLTSDVTDEMTGDDAAGEGGDFASARHAEGEFTGSNLDELTSEMDDELLQGHGGDVHAHRGAGTARSARRRSSRWILPLAAALVLGGTALYFFVLEPQGTAGTKAVVVGTPAAGKGTRPPVDTGGEASGAGAAVDPIATTVDPIGVDPVRASRELFEDRFLVAIRLGFLGEVGDE
jgi:hypothetical protein